MLPTLAVILWAYGMYALISGMTRRKGSYLRGHSRRRGYVWGTLLGCTGLGLGLIIYFSTFSGPQDRLKLAGFLGTVWAEGWPDKVHRLEYPPVQDQGAGDKPAYALLHPETPPMQVAPEKTSPRPRPVHKPKAHKSTAAQTKTAKASPAVKKDKAAGKTRGKKKKAATPRSRKAASG